MSLSRLDHVSREHNARRRVNAAVPGARAAPVTALRDYRDRRPLAVAHTQNALLAALPAADLERLARGLEPVALPARHVICEAGRCPDHVYFPVAGIVALATELASGATADVAVTGCEGVVGVTLFQGGNAATTRAVVRAASHGYRLCADALAVEFRRCEALRQVLLGYTQTLFTQAAQTAACRGHHSVIQQVCRTLLAVRDRLPGDELALTHDVVAESLGVRRESVTLAAGVLQEAGVIRYWRGRMTILDRGALEGRACECYAVVRADSRPVPMRPASVDDRDARAVGVGRHA
jgi:CRP-like cAMP-binding protein